MTKFKEILKNNLEILELYVPVVARVHGDAHPEFLEVRKHYESLRDKIEDPEADLSIEFEQMRDITAHYLVPPDVCESYEAVYKLLRELDKAYQEDH